MNKLLVFFSLILVASMVFVTTPNTVHAASQLDILIKITQNTKEHIKNDIDKMDSSYLREGRVHLVKELIKKKIY